MTIKYPTWIKTLKIAVIGLLIGLGVFLLICSLDIPDWGKNFSLNLFTELLGAGLIALLALTYRKEFGIMNNQLLNLSKEIDMVNRINEAILTDPKIAWIGLIALKKFKLGSMKEKYDTSVDMKERKKLENEIKLVEAWIKAAEEK